MIRERIRHMTLLEKLVSITAIAMLLMLVSNLYIFSEIREMNKQIAVVYTDNTNLKEFSDKLEHLHQSVEEYVSNRSTEAIEAYYRDDEAFRQQIENLNQTVSDDEILLAEKNLYGLSETYLSLASDIIQAKRGRNVEKYGALSEEAEKVQMDIRTCIESLNAKQFSQSSERYVSLMRELEYMQNLCLMLLLLLMIGNIMATLFLTGRLMEPLRALKEAAYSVAAGNLDREELEVIDLDEVGIVTDAFNKMLSSIRSYIHQIQEKNAREKELQENEYRMQGYLKDAQLTALQAQIKPHFLFNTLNAGVQLAMMENAEKTQVLLENTAAFYRYNASKVNKSTTIREEIDMVDAYIYISKVRFGDSFIFDKDVDESLLDVKVPSMILQPIVENSFKYGIKDLEDLGRIELTVQRIGDKIRIAVWDNGRGIEKERIQEVLNMTDSIRLERKESGGVGLHNVRERLRLFFNNQAVLDIESEGLGMGAEVVITIPYEGE